MNIILLCSHVVVSFIRSLVTNLRQTTPRPGINKLLYQVFVVPFTTYFQDVAATKIKISTFSQKSTNAMT